MNILLEELPHQLAALEALDKSFYGIDYATTDPDKDYVYANPIIKNRGQETTNIDIKMETGTGKLTWVFEQCMNSTKIWFIQIHRRCSDTSDKRRLEKLYPSRLCQTTFCTIL